MPAIVTARSRWGKRGPGRARSAGHSARAALRVGARGSCAGVVAVLSLYRSITIYTGEMPVRMTWPTALVLAALDEGCGHGFEIIDVTGLRAGTVYPILRRLEADRQVRSSWERVTQARAEGRPPRRNYRLTAAGKALVAEAHRRYPGAAVVLRTRGDEQPA